MANEICISKQEIIENLQAKGKKQRELHKKAAHIRENSVSKNVYFRGIIEFSNICNNDCFYCGIRKSNKQVKRYLMGKGEILECVKFCDKAKYGSVVLQSGELQTKKFTDFATGIVKTIKKMTYDEIINDLISRKMQDIMRANFNKIYPLKVCEIRYLGVEAREKQEVKAEVKE